MSEIITITLNTAIDNILEIKNFKLGSVVKASSYIVQSGKGINVARAISSLGVSVTALGFIGSKEEGFFNELNSSNLKIQLNTVDGPTRTNISLLDSEHKLIIHARTSGYNLSNKNVSQILTKLKTMINKNSFVIISGSVPSNELSNAYFKIIKQCQKNGGTVLLDTSGLELKKGLAAIPDIIKPNIEELEDLTSKKLDTITDIVSAAKYINNIGTKLVFVSMGSKGVILTKKDTTGYWKASINLTLTDYPGMEIGCGDSMIAGIATSTLKKYDIPKLLKTAVGCATANLYAKEPGKLKRTIVKDFIKKTTVEFFPE